MSHRTPSVVLWKEVRDIEVRGHREFQDDKVYNRPGSLQDDGPKMKKTINTTGKRKSAIARAVLRDGKGIIRINSFNLDVMQPKFAKMKIQEPLVLAEELAKKVDIDVNVIGGGWQSQSEASRLAIARALVEFSGSKKLKQDFLSYDRNLLVQDSRSREPRKPNDSRARAMRQKSYR